MKKEEEALFKQTALVKAANSNHTFTITQQALILTNSVCLNNASLFFSLFLIIFFMKGL